MFLLYILYIGSKAESPNKRFMSPMSISHQRTLDYMRATPSTSPESQLFESNSKSPKLSKLSHCYPSHKSSNPLNASNVALWLIQKRWHPTRREHVALSCMVCGASLTGIHGPSLHGNSCCRESLSPSRAISVQVPWNILVELWLIQQKHLL